MKLAWNVLCILLLLHFLAAAGFVVWLRAEDRLDTERIRRVYDMFRMTIEEEKAQQEEEARLAAQTQEEVEHLAWLRQVSTGSQTMFERLDAAQQSDDMSNVIYDRVRREVRDLHAMLANSAALLAAEREAIERERAALDERINAERERRESEDFQQAVKLYEQLRPKQAKQMFQELLENGQTEEVVEYLAAMQVRKAAAVLGEFKSPQEVPQGTMLIERLRQRGIDTGAMEYTGGRPGQGGPAI